MAKALNLTAAKISMVLNVTQEVLLTCAEQGEGGEGAGGWASKEQATKVWNTMISERAASSVHSHAHSSHQMQSQASASGAFSSSSAAAGELEDGAGGEGETTGAEASPTADSSDPFRASEAHAVTDWCTTHGMLRHYDMYQHALTQPRAEKSIHITAFVEEPLPTPPLAGAEFVEEVRSQSTEHHNHHLTEQDGDDSVVGEGGGAA
jgi:hypothetical protein